MPAQIKLSDWEIFEVLGEVGSFRKASEILRLDSANIKRSVDKLEPTLNLRLFNRQLPAFFYSLPRGSLKTATVA